MEKKQVRHEGMVITEQPILDFLTQKGLNPDDYRLSNAFTFEQLEENGEYEHTGLELHVMKKEHTDEAFIVHSDFHQRALDLTNEEGVTLDTGVGLRYMNEDGYKPSFFEVADLYSALGVELPEEFASNEPVEETVTQKEILPVTNQEVLAYLSKHGQKPEDFRMVEIGVYSDTMNDGNYHYLGKESYVVKKELADTVALIGYNFTHTKVTLYDEAENELDSTVGIGYDDLIAPTAFSIGDVVDVVGV